MVRHHLQGTCGGAQCVGTQEVPNACAWPMRHAGNPLLVYCVFLTRRRATSHRRYIHLRRPNARLSAFKRQRRDGVGEGHGETEQRPTNRRMRRRPARLQATAMSTSSPVQQADAGNTDTEMADAGARVSASVPATAAAPPKGRRLESHTWHARRMRMHSSMWGHALPMQAAGRGRGSRSLLHHMRTHALMHDASYWGCVQLRGHQKDLATILKSMT